MKKLWLFSLALGPALAAGATRPPFVRCERALVELRVSDRRGPAPRRPDVAPTHASELAAVVRDARALVTKARRPREFRVSLDLDEGASTHRLARYGDRHFTLDLHAFNHPTLGHAPGYAYAYGLQVAHDAFTRRSFRYAQLHNGVTPTPETERLLLLARIARETYAWILTNLVYDDADTMTRATDLERFSPPRALESFAATVVRTALRDHTLTRKAAAAAALGTLADYWTQQAEMVALSPTPWGATARKIDFLEGSERSVELPFANHDLAGDFQRHGFRRRGTTRTGRSTMFVGEGEDAREVEVRSTNVNRLTLTQDVVGDPGGTRHLSTQYAIVIDTDWDEKIRLPLVHAGSGDEDYEEYEVSPATREMAAWFGIASGAITHDGRARFQGETPKGELLFHTFGD